MLNNVPIEFVVAVHTYVLGPNKVEHIDYYSGNEGSELCDKVMYLGKCIVMI